MNISNNQIKNYIYINSHKTINDAAGDHYKPILT